MVDHTPGTAVLCLTCLTSLTGTLVSAAAQEPDRKEPEVQRLTVRIGPPRIVVRDRFYPSLLSFPDGSIILTALAGPNCGTTQHLRSTDAGKTWQSFARGMETGIDGSLGVRLDGTVVGLSQQPRLVPGKPDTYVGERWTSTDAWQTITGPTPGYVQCPDLAVGNAEGQDVKGPTFFGSFHPLANGDLLAPMYATFKADAQWPKYGSTTKFRAILVTSSDGGVQWRYVSTIACMDALGATDPQAIQEFHEGFTETELAVLPGRGAGGQERLVCVSRTGTYVPESAPSESYHDLAATLVTPAGKYVSAGEPTKPLYLAISADAGQTWSRPRPIAPARGACPRLLLLRNGVLALSYGRVARPSQGNGIIFSLDGGDTWTEDRLVSPAISTGYTSMVATAPGRILYTYDVASAWPWWNGPGYTAVVDIEIEVR